MTVGGFKCHYIEFHLALFIFEQSSYGAILALAQRPPFSSEVYNTGSLTEVTRPVLPGPRNSHHFLFLFSTSE